MQISSRFSIAVHSLLVIGYFQDKIKITGNKIAASVNTNPVIIRKLIVQLKQAGLVTVVVGSGGTSLAKPPQSISLLDIYTAVNTNSENNLFGFHSQPNIKCPIGRNIHAVLDMHMEFSQMAMEKCLEKITLKELIDQLSEKIALDKINQ